jgi:UDP-N-acetylglucosamine 2-epimerase (non-hydrolysing)
MNPGRIRVMLIFGTRPEAIKMAPVYLALRERSAEFETRVCVTAQHREMLDQVLELFDIEPDVDLDLMTAGQDLYAVTCSVLTGIRDVLRQYRPDVALVHGDTTTTMASSMAAFYEKVALGHVEAGLRTWDLYSPFPEEFNRQVASRVARWHFAPTPGSAANLAREGIARERVHITGNTVIDALHWVLGRVERDPRRKGELNANLDRLLAFSWRSARFVLVTGHRRENFGQRLLDICQALREIAGRDPQLHIVYPVHLNPNVLEPVTRMLSGLRNVHLIEPLDYEPFVYLMRHCYLVLTDSGGIQEEAPSLGKPVLVMRDVTERPEAVEAGTVRLVGADTGAIVTNVGELLQRQDSYESMARAHNPYGDGLASGRIADILKSEGRR